MVLVIAVKGSILSAEAMSARASAAASWADLSLASASWADNAEGETADVVAGAIDPIELQAVLDGTLNP